MNMKKSLITLIALIISGFAIKGGTIAYKNRKDYKGYLKSLQ